MHIHSMVKKGRVYYESRESYWEGGACHHRTVALGRCPTVEDAYREYERRYFERRRGRARDPFTEADRKAWERLEDIERLRRHHEPGYRQAPRFAAEARRWARHLYARERERLRDARLSRGTGSCGTAYYALLGLSPGATVEQIRAAYRRKARECHPDHGGDDASMAEVNRAYEWLTDCARAG